MRKRKRTPEERAAWQARDAYLGERIRYLGELAERVRIDIDERERAGRPYPKAPPLPPGLHRPAIEPPPR